MSNSKKMAFVTIGDNKSIEMREVPATVKVGESFDDFVPLQSDATKFEKVTIKVHGFAGGDNTASTPKSNDNTGNGKSRFKGWMKWVAVVVVSVVVTALLFKGCGSDPQGHLTPDERQQIQKHGKILK
jgi:hypothetical protein